MSETPKHLRYTKSHEWVQDDGEGVVTVGITDHAQAQLGDIVFVELPEAGTAIAAGDEVAVIESVKTAADVYSPVAGEIVAVNDALNDAPELVNQSPYADGWLFKVAISEPEKIEALLDADNYLATC